MIKLFKAIRSNLVTKQVKGNGFGKRMCYCTGLQGAYWLLKPVDFFRLYVGHKMSYLAVLFQN